MQLSTLGRPDDCLDQVVQIGLPAGFEVQQSLGWPHSEDIE